MPIVSLPHRSSPATQRGLTLIELMISITISMFLMAVLAEAFVRSSRVSTEIDRANQQIENGRYAMQVLSDDLQLAGYWGEFDINAAVAAMPPNNLAVPTALPNPCDTTIAGLRTSLLFHVQDYSAPPSTNCLGGDVKSGTGIVVVRRASTSETASAALSAAPNTVLPFFQASGCAAEQRTGLSSQYRLNTGANNASLNLTRLDCLASNPAPTRQYLTHIYFIANNDVGTGTSGDKIPTLKRAELGVDSTGSALGFNIVPIAEGIENIQFEYGIDNDNDGYTNTYTPDPAASGVAANYLNVMSVKVHLLARANTPSTGYSDGNTYTLGASTVTPTTPYDKSFRRHVFNQVVRLQNPEGRRE